MRAKRATFVKNIEESDEVDSYASEASHVCQKNIEESDIVDSYASEVSHVCQKIFEESGVIGVCKINKLLS